MMATTQALDIKLESCFNKQTALWGLNSQGTASKDTNEDDLGTLGDLQTAEVRDGSHKQDDVVDNVEASDAVVQRRAIDAAAGNVVVPVLGDGPASEDAGAFAEDGVDGQPRDEADEDLASLRGAEDALVLEQNGELDKQLGEVVGDDGAEERDKEVDKRLILDGVAEAVFDLCTWSVVCIPCRCEGTPTVHRRCEERDRSEL
jgi:hypothetical protein